VQRPAWQRPRQLDGAQRRRRGAGFGADDASDESSLENDDDDGSGGDHGNGSGGGNDDAKGPDRRNAGATAVGATAEAQQGGRGDPIVRWHAQVGVLDADDDGEGSVGGLGSGGDAPSGGHGGGGSGGVRPPWVRAHGHDDDDGSASSLSGDSAESRSVMGV